PLAFGDLADSGVSLANEPAGSQRRCFEVHRIGRQHLPVCDVPSEQPDRAHRRKFAPQALVMLGGRRQPDTVVLARVFPVTEDQDDLVLDIDGEAAKHRARVRRERIERELVRYALASLAREQSIVEALGRGFAHDGSIVSAGTPMRGLAASRGYGARRRRRGASVELRTQLTRRVAPMKPRITLLTLGVDDLERSMRF